MSVYVPRYYVETIEYSWCSRETLLVIGSMGFCLLSVFRDDVKSVSAIMGLSLCPSALGSQQEEKQMKWSVSRAFPQAGGEADTHTLIVLYGTELRSVVEESWSVRQRASCTVAKQKTGSASR